MTNRRLSAAVIITRYNRDGKLETLMQLKRKQNKWEFVGGKQEGIEIIEDCAVRETKEEVDIDIVSLKQLAYMDVGKKYGCIIFLANQWDGTPCINEPHKTSAIGWFEFNTVSFLPLTKPANNVVKAGLLLKVLDIVGGRI